MTRKRRWFEKQTDARKYADEVGGKVGSATVLERPFANAPYFVDYLAEGGSTPTVWTPTHLFADVVLDPKTN